MNPGGLFVSSSGNVGIGTTSPSAKLHVNGSTGSPTYKGFAYTYLGSETLTDEVLFQAVVNGYTSNVPLYLFKDQRTDQQTTQRIFEIQGGRSGVGTILTTLASGNVGIGTTSPSSLLHVSSSAAASTIFRVDTAASNGTLFVSSSGRIGIGNTNPTETLFLQDPNRNPTLGITHAGGGAYFMKFQQFSGWNQLMTFTSAASYMGINTSGPLILNESGSNVGIGTTSPSQKLHIDGFVRTSGVSVNKTGGTISAFIGYEQDWIGTGTSNDLAIAAEGSNDIKFYTDGTATVKMFISASGLIGVNNTNPQAKLDLGASVGGIYRNSFFFYNDNNGGPYHGTKNGFYMDQFNLSNNSTLTFSTAAGAPGTFYICSKDTDVNTSSSLTPRMVILGQSGNVGIGTTNPSYKLDVNGVIAGKDLLRLTPTSTVSVSTSTTTISTTTNDYGAIAIVWGADSSGNIFTDLLFYSLSTVTVMQSQSPSGSPVGRTYSMSSGNLRLAMASGTYTVRYQAIFAQ